MKANQACHRVATMCRVLGVSPSGYYAWRSRGRSLRAKRDEALGGTIRTLHEASRGTYGAPRMHAELMAGGCRVGRKRVARLMRESGLAGVSRRRGARTTRVEPGHHAAPDRVERQFQADGPDRLWVADVTYVPTWAGFVYLAIVLDAFSRRVMAIFQFIEGGYNPRRRHSALGYLSPNDFERAEAARKLHRPARAVPDASQIGEPKGKTYPPGIPYPQGMEKTLRPPAIAHLRAGGDSPNLSTKTGILLYLSIAGIRLDQRSARQTLPARLK